MGVKVTNNAWGTLAAGITNVATSISLTGGQGARFPTLTGADYFYLTITDASNNMEIVKVTARSTDALTVVRAQDGTAARAWLLGDRVELRPCAALFNELAPTANPTFTGTITTPLTAARALVTGASSELAVSAVTATELGYMSGVTSAVQTQLNSLNTLKAPKDNPTFTGTLNCAVFSSTGALGTTGGAIWNFGFSGDNNRGVFYGNQAGTQYFQNQNNAWSLTGSLAINGALSGVTTLNTSSTITAGGNIQSGGNVHTANNGANYLYSYGSIYAQGDVIAYYSDMRLKEVVAPITDATRKINSLDAFTFKKSALGRELLGDTDEVRPGVSAQQIKEVLPEAVHLAAFDRNDDGTSKSGEEYLTVQYDKLVPLLIAGFKELSAEVARNRLELKILRAQLRKDAE